jgi:glycosyltransferase involved in cell wall biosynthesis
MQYLFVFLVISFRLFGTEPFFHVVIPTYNNEKWCIQNLESVLRQNYPAFRITIINDTSTDKTGPLLERYIARNKLSHKVRLVHNRGRSGMLANIYNAVRKMNPRSIVVTVDGDDTLRGTDVFTILKNVYKDQNVWMTYGSWVSDPPGARACNCRAFPEKIVQENRFRQHGYISSQLRTFYAKLFQKINKKDLQHNGKFFMTAGDVAFMIPMLEMASKGHFYYVKDVLYAYNMQNPISDFRVCAKERTQCSKQIRSKRPYKPLKTLF